jgi:phosphoglycerol transferase MdoB-like AlkP superfamily enzyme
MCGTYSRIGPEYIRENPEYTTGNVCIFDFLDELNYKKYFLVGHHLGYSGLKTFFKNKGVNVVDSTYFIKYHPELIDIGTHWGIQDTDYARWLAEEIEKISSRDEKFFIGGFFINTHSPFFTAPDCNLYKENDKQLNSIHCVDQAVGILWDKILKLKLIDNSIIILLGDTPGIDPVTKKWDPYSKPLMVVRIPGVEGRTSKVNFHTPDVGVTLMELIGTNIQKINIGHSAVSLRKDKQFLVSEGYIIDSGKFSRLKKCIKEDSKEIKVNKFLLYNPCYLDKTLKYLHQIFIDNDINKKIK